MNCWFMRRILKGCARGLMRILLNVTINKSFLNAIDLGLGKWTRKECTYAGGGKDISDLELVQRLSNGRVDLTFGSALDIFGGDKVRFKDACAWNDGIIN